MSLFGVHFIQARFIKRTIFEGTGQHNFATRRCDAVANLNVEEIP
jgi:hypothetical protein